MEKCITIPEEYISRIVPVLIKDVEEIYDPKFSIHEDYAIANIGFSKFFTGRAEVEVKVKDICLEEGKKSVKLNFRTTLKSETISGILAELFLNYIGHHWYNGDHTFNIEEYLGEDDLITSILEAVDIKEIKCGKGMLQLVPAWA